MLFLVKFPKFVEFFFEMGGIKMGFVAFSFVNGFVAFNFAIDFVGFGLAIGFVKFVFVKFVEICECCKVVCGLEEFA